MILGIFLSLGDSFADMKKSGQDVRFKTFYLNKFAENYEKVYIFSYADESADDLPKNAILIKNKYHLHRYVYGILLPILNLSQVLECDIIRCYHLSGTLPGIVSKLLFNKKYIFNLAYDYFKFALIERKYLQAGFFKLIEKFSLLFAFKVFAANKSLLKRYQSKKTVYLPNGIDTQYFHPISRPKNKAISLLCVGRLEPQKNYLLLLDALADLSADFKLLIVGSGTLKTQIVEKAKNLKIPLTIENRIENTRMPSIYHQADIFLMPSLIEGHPKALLEAMSCGLAVIGSKVEGIVDIIDDNRNGVLCEVSATDIRRAIANLTLHPSKLRLLGAAARQTVIKKYDLNFLLETEIKEMSP